MTVKALSPNLSVSPQIQPADLAELAAHGFRSIICNRPDGESPDQPEWQSIKEAAHACELAAAHIPVVTGDIVDQDVAAFAQALEDLPKPILAYCRSGTRSAILWALSNNGSLTAEERIRTGARAGYNFEVLRDRMEQGS